MLVSQSLDGMKDSSCRLWFPCSLWLAPVNALQQHRQLRSRQTHRTTGGLRPDEAPTLQPFLKKTQSVPIEPQQLDQVARYNDVPHTDRALSLFHILGIHCTANSCA
jgi:hypothetical protein